MSALNIQLLCRKSKRFPKISLTLSGSNYPYLKQISMMFKPLNFKDVRAIEVRHFSVSILLIHYENTSIQVHRKFHLQELKIFHISAQNIDCGYSLEPPRRGGSNEYHNLCF